MDRKFIENQSTIYQNVIVEEIHKLKNPITKEEFYNEYFRDLFLKNHKESDEGECRAIFESAFYAALVNGKLKVS